MIANNKSHVPVDQVIKLLFADPDWNFKLGVGCLINGAAYALLLVNLLLLPLCFCLWSLVVGYIIMTTTAKANNPHSKLPSWTNFWEILIGGGIWIGISTVHFLFFLLIVLISLVIGEITGLDNILAPSFLVWASTVWTIFVFAGLALSITTLFLMVNFATQQNMKAGFAVKEVFLRLSHQPKQMLEAWLIQLGLLFIATVIPLLTVLGVFIIPSTIFFAQLVGCCILSQSWHESRLDKETG